jgi:hypothetical protein
MIEMKQLKTKSYMDCGWKCWTITTPDGDTFDCQPHGQRYTCGDSKPMTLKQIKQSIIDGIEYPIGEPEDTEAEQQEEYFRELWDCVSLGALLIDRLGVDACEADPQIMESLNCAGWLLRGADLIGSTTSIDVGRVRRELDKHFTAMPEMALQREIGNDGKSSDISNGS